MAKATEFGLLETEIFVIGIHCTKMQLPGQNLY